MDTEEEYLSVYEESLEKNVFNREFSVVGKIFIAKCLPTLIEMAASCQRRDRSLDFGNLKS